MFENLGNRLQDAIHKIKGYGKITEDNISDIIKEVRIALLEADVNYKVVKEFVANVKDSSVNYLCKSNCDLSAGELIKDASIKSNGNGGGSRMFGQGGGTNSENVDMIIDYVKDKVENI